MSDPENTQALGAEQSASGAFVVPENKYHGSPCKRCGGTLRLKSNRTCVKCARERVRRRRANPENHERELQARREKYANDHEWAERERAKARERMRGGSERYRNDPEYRKRVCEYQREYRLKKRDERILADPTIQEFLRMQHPLVKKLEAMIGDRAASQGEKDNAYRILERKGLLPTSNRRNAWLLRQTTFGATPNTQHEMKSLPS